VHSIPKHENGSWALQRGRSAGACKIVAAATSAAGCGVTGASFQAFLPGMAVWRLGGACTLHGMPRAAIALGIGIRQPRHAAGNFAATAITSTGAWPPGTRDENDSAVLFRRFRWWRHDTGSLGCWPCWTAHGGQDLDAGLDPVGAIARGAATSPARKRAAAVDRRCSPPRPGDAGEPDAIQAFAIANRAGRPTHRAGGIRRPGHRALPSSATSALAVVRDTLTGRYAAYVITVVCGL